MRDVAVVSFAQSQHVRREAYRNEVELLMPVLHQVKSDVGLDQNQIDFTCSGSTDYLAGSAFSFVQTLDGVGASPPISIAMPPSVSAATSVFSASRCSFLTALWVVKVAR